MLHKTHALQYICKTIYESLFFPSSMWVTEIRSLVLTAAPLPLNLLVDPGLGILV